MREDLACSNCTLGRASAKGQCPFVERRHKAGVYVQLEGSAAHAVAFIKSGSLSLSRATNDGAEIVCAVRSVGAFVGMEALVRDTYLHTARTLTPARLCTISRESFRHWVGGEGTPARAALDNLLDTLALDTPRGARPDGRATVRVARWILSVRNEQLVPSIPREALAGILGMAPETLSRALATLAEGGGISVTRRSIVIRDAAELESAAAR